jgi:hypothetical protein
VKSDRSSGGLSDPFAEMANEEEPIKRPSASAVGISEHLQKSHKIAREFAGLLPGKERE